MLCCTLFPNAGRFRPDWAAEVNTEEEEGEVEEEREEGVEETEAHPRGKRGFGFRGAARAAEAHHNFERVLSAQLVNATILNYIMVANRTVELHEDMINRALGTASHLPRRLDLCGWTLTHTLVATSPGAWVALWRMSDTGEMYYNRVIGLNNMAYNLSTSAAQVRLLGSLLPRDGGHLTHVDWAVRVLLLSVDLRRLCEHSLGGSVPR